MVPRQVYGEPGVDVVLVDRGLPIAIPSEGRLQGRQIAQQPPCGEFLKRLFSEDHPLSIELRHVPRDDCQSATQDHQRQRDPAHDCPADTTPRDGGHDIAAVGRRQDCGGVFHG